jgi:hypothetical protein
VGGGFFFPLALALALALALPPVAQATELGDVMDAGAGEQQPVGLEVASESEGVRQRTRVVEEETPLDQDRASPRHQTSALQ